FVSGLTDSSNFPTTAGVIDTTANGGDDAFIARLLPNGTALSFSTYLGGSGNDRANGITLDSAGSVYVTGKTASANFPTTAGAFDTSLNGGDDGFLVKLNNTGTTVTFATYLGGSGADDPQDLVLDNVRNVFVVGRTASANFPTTAGAFDTTANGGDDAF